MNTFLRTTTKLVLGELDDPGLIIGLGGGSDDTTKAMLVLLGALVALFLFVYFFG